MAIPREQADFDARFAAMTAGTFLHVTPASLPRCEDLTEQDFTDGGGLTVSGVDTGELRRFYELEDRWHSGELSFDELAAELGRGDPGE